MKRSAMKRWQRNKGFSLIEILLAVGVLGVGMLFIAGVFPVAIRFSQIACERSIGAVAADEAFATVRLYAASKVQWLNLSDKSFVYFKDYTVFGATKYISDNDLTYPSASGMAANEKRYNWSAICRISDANDLSGPVQVVVESE